MSDKLANHIIHQSSELVWDVELSDPLGLLLHYVKGVPSVHGEIDLSEEDMHTQLLTLISTASRIPGDGLYGIQNMEDRYYEWLWVGMTSESTLRRLIDKAYDTLSNLDSEELQRVANKLGFGEQ